jgi:hypothetical protein
MWKTAKLKFLMDSWNFNLKEFIDEVAGSKVGIPMLKNFRDTYDIDLVKKFWSLYLERCIFMHALVFFQFRKRIKGTTVHDVLDLQKIFYGRRDYMFSLIQTVDHLAKENRVAIKYINEHT